MAFKLDRRLLDEVQVRRQRAMAAGKTAHDLASERYQVTIELAQAIRPSKGQTRAETLRELERQTHTRQDEVTNLLTSMGVTDFQALPLSNSIKTSLTIAQIDKIAEHPEVKIVRLVKPERVITSNSC
jgi:hypothetical protein